MNAAPKKKKTNPWVSLMICALAGLAIVCFQLKSELQRSRLKSTGEIEHGRLVSATRHSVNFIPMGYSLSIGYAGTVKAFDVSRDLFYRHVNAEGRYHPGEQIDVQYLPDRPSIAEVPEMLKLYIWWLGGPLLGYGFGGGLLLLTLKGMKNLSRSRP